MVKNDASVRRLREALRWTWAALVLTYVAGSLVVYFGVHSPVWIVPSVAGATLMVIAFNRTLDAGGFRIKDRKSGDKL